MGCEGVPQDRVQWQVLEDTVMELQIPYKRGISGPDEQL